MLSADLSTMALADVLQWADATRVRGTLTVQRDSGAVAMQVADRSVVAASPPVNRPVGAAAGGYAAAVPAVTEGALAVEQLYDQFLDPEGSLVLKTADEGAAVLEGGVAVDMLIAELLMEGLRLLDEWPRIHALYPSESARLDVLEEPEAPQAELRQAILECARQRLTLESTRLALGLSRPALLRRVEELRALGLVGVEGAPEGADLIAKLISQAKVLLKEQQFDEATHVFRALLSADPGAHAVKQLLREAEAEQRRVLAEKLPSRLIVDLSPGAPPPANLSFAEREVVDRVNGRWDIGVIVLSSPMRESETLKVIDRLRRRGVLRLSEPG